MAKTKQRLLSAVLGISMVWSAAPTSLVFAEEESTNAILWEANFDGTDDKTYWGHDNTGGVVDNDYTYWKDGNHIKDGKLYLTPNNASYGKFVVAGSLTNEATVSTVEGTPVDKVETLDDGTVKTTTTKTDVTTTLKWNKATTTTTTTTVKTEKDGNVTTEDPVVDTKTTYAELDPRTTLFDLTGKENIMWESKIKWKYPAADVDEDGYIKKSDDAFLRIVGQNNNYYANIHYEGDNGIGYGGTQQKADQNYDTGEKFKNNEWYIVRIFMNNKTSKMKLEFESVDGIKDGEKHTYSGLWAYMAYNLAINQVCKLCFTRQLSAGMETEIDYSKLVDMSLLPIATASYKDADLDGAGGVAAGDTATVSFENAITEADLDNITIDGGAAITKTLSDDGKTVTVTFSALKSKTKYTLTVGDIGLNVGAAFSFTSAKDASDPYYANFRFDETDADYNGWYKGNGSVTETDISTDITSWISDGYLNGDKMSASYSTYTYVFNPEPDLSGCENIIAEARVMADYPDGKAGANDTVIEYTRFMSWNGSRNMIQTKKNDDGVTCLAYGGDDNGYGGAVITDFPIYNGKFYTYQATINYKTCKWKLSVWDDDGNRYDGDFINFRYNNKETTLQYFRLIYHGKDDPVSKTDYFKVYNKDLLPSAEINYGGADLDGASGVPQKFEATVSFPVAVTEAEMNAITTTAESVTKTLSADGKSITLGFTGLDEYKPYSVIIPDGSEYVGTTAKFVTKWADKYIIRAEFDGYDDYSNLYSRNLDGGAYEGNNVDAGVVSNGLFSTSAGIYSGLEWNNGENIDMTGKKNIVVQSRFKYSGSGNVWGKDFFKTIYAYINNERESTSSHAWLWLDSDGFLHNYNSTCTGGDSNTGYKIEKDIFYTLTVKLDFESHKYSFTISNDNGDIASVSETNFTYNNASNELRGVIVTRNYKDCARSYVDYLRVWDGDYGKATVRTMEGADLDRNAAIPTSGNVFSISFTDEVSGTDGITIKSENGTVIDCALSPNGSYGIDVIPQDNFSEDTAYTMTIPKTLLGVDEDQKITFRTVCDTTKAFSMPTALAGKDSLNVVYFGGSITENQGWRTHVSEKLTKLFGDEGVTVNNINAGVGGTGANWGWQRLGRDVISKNPDVVFIEFAVNDSNSPTAAQDMESLVRNLNSLENRPVIIFVYTTVMNFSANENTISEHERIAKAYGIPTISIHDRMLTYYNSDTVFKAKWDDKTYLSDGTHPGAEVSVLYGDYVNGLLEHHSDKYFVLPKTNDEVKALTACRNYYYDYAAQESFADTDKSFTFNGDSFLLSFGAASGTYTLTVDGETVAEGVAYAATPKGTVTYSGFGDGTHTAVLTAAGTVNLSGIFTIHNTGASFTKPEFDADAVVENVMLNVTAKYTAYEKTPVALIIALYDEENNLTAVQSIETETDASGVEREISTGLKAKSGDKKAKAFLWKSKKSQQSLTESAALGF